MEIVAGIVYRRSTLELLQELIFLKVLNANFWYLQYLVGCYLCFYGVTRFIKEVPVRFFVWGLSAVGSFFLFGNLQGEQAVSFLCGLAVAELPIKHRMFF